MTYICPRTGRSYATEALALSIEGDCTEPAALAVGTAIPIPASASSPGGVDTRLRDIYGNLITNQTHSSQFWMNAGYTGEEPDMATKAYYSDAGYAYDNAVAIAAAAVATQPSFNPRIIALSQQAEYGSAESKGILENPVPAALQNFLNGISGSATNVIDWLTRNFLLVVIIIGAVLLVPRLLDVALPTGRHRRWR